ncbi:MAG: CRISPR-associated protein Cas4 [Candidatus Bathyarchaeota archaeon]|nr:CRISPR-associated protein Cas4 [Candidatus Bathyarchaeota archaeon]
MRLKVWDIREYAHCPRRLWLNKKTQIKENSDYSTGRKYHTLLRTMLDLLSRALKADLSGRVVATEVRLSREIGTEIYLSGKIDVLRWTKEGYIIQENKSSNPPKDQRVRHADQLQVDAYAFLMEGDERYKDVPIKSGVILYNDLRPIEIKPEPAHIPKILERMKDTLKLGSLPEIRPNTRCLYCYYSPLCQVLPREGGLSARQIHELPQSLETRRLESGLTVESIRNP